VSSVAEIVIEVIAEKMGVPKEDVKPEAHLVNDLNVDSLDQADIVMELEEKFDMSVSEEEAAKIRTVGDIIKYIEQHKS